MIGEVDTEITNNLECRDSKEEEVSCESGEAGKLNINSDDNPNSGTPDVNLTHNGECGDFKEEASCESDEAGRLVDSDNNQNNTGTLDCVRKKPNMAVHFCHFIIEIVLIFALIGTQLHVDNDNSEMVNQTSVRCLKDLNMSLGEYLGNDPRFDCVNITQRITRERCASRCRRGDHIYKCQSNGSISKTTIQAENIRKHSVLPPRCDGYPKQFDIEIINDVGCDCLLLDYEELGIFDAGP